MKKKLALKLMFPVASLVLIGAGVVGWVLAQSVESSIVERASSDVTSRLASLDEAMSMVRDIGVEKVSVSLGIMKNCARGWGLPSRAGTTKVGQETVPNLFLGGHSLANDFTLVDNTTAVAGGTATVFVRRDNDFVRISTNVKKPDGSRAIGTLLDPKGKAIAAILQNQPFYGVVDILGAPYITGYEPIIGKDGSVVGIFYAGYPVTTLNYLKESIEKFRPLNVGFAALLDGKGNVVFHGKEFSPDQVKAIAGVSENSQDWVVQLLQVKAWGYSLLGAYPRSVVASQVLTAKLLVGMGAVLVAAILMGTIWFLVNRIITKPLAQVAAHMENADLTARFDTQREDEIGRLLKAFDRFVGSIREILLEVTQASNAVVSSSTEISASAEQMSAGAQEQTSQTAEVATAVEEMTKTIVENSSNTLGVAQVAKQEKAAAENGGAVVQETIHGMRSIAEAVTRAAGIVEALGKSSEQIGAIIQVIDDIADQTNLLALNAAIEAARAGEQGRGFAVVADEVRKLAERTTNATKEIGGMITSIQESTSAAVTAMEEGRGQVDHGLKLADRAGESLSGIVNQSQDLLDKITQIAGAIEQQSTTAETIAKNTEAIRKVSEETAQGTRQLAKAADDLNRLTDSLHERLARVKLAASSDGAAPHAAARRTAGEHNASNVAVGARGELMLHQ